jgi:hypothetical protein
MRPKVRDKSWKTSDTTIMIQSICSVSRDSTVGNVWNLHDARFFGVASGPISLKSSDGRKNVTQSFDICYRRENEDMIRRSCTNRWIGTHVLCLFGKPFIPSGEVSIKKDEEYGYWCLGSRTGTLKQILPAERRLDDGGDEFHAAVGTPIDTGIVFSEDPRRQ